MQVRIVADEEVMSFISAYGSQMGLEEEKRKFWDNLDNIMRTIPENEKSVPRRGLQWTHRGGSQELSFGTWGIWFWRKE